MCNLANLTHLNCAVGTWRGGARVRALMPARIFDRRTDHLGVNGSAECCGDRKQRWSRRCSEWHAEPDVQRADQLPFARREAAFWRRRDRHGEDKYHGTSTLTLGTCETLFDTVGKLVVYAVNFADSTPFPISVLRVRIGTDYNGDGVYNGMYSWDSDWDKTTESGPAAITVSQGGLHGSVLPGTVDGATAEFDWGAAHARSMVDVT